jgi:hypothetical protein
VACVQENKKESFDSKFIKKICPRGFDNFSFAPSVGASGGILIVWKSAMFEGRLIESRRFGVIIEFTSRHSAQKWTLVCVYGPCVGEDRDQFVQWLYDLLSLMMSFGYFWGISTSLGGKITEINLVEMLMTCSCLMKLSVIWVYWNSPSKEELLLGLICKMILYLFSLIGCSPLPIG